MGRLTNAIMNGASSIAAGSHAPMLDPTFGGQQGFTPDYTQWISNQSYIRKNLFCLLLEAPKGFNYLAEPDKYIGILKAMVELHPLSIDGLNAGLEAEFSETPVGGSGQMHEHLTDIKETRSNPTFRLDEKYGNVFQKFIRLWMTQLGMDPHSKVAGIGMQSNRPSDMLADISTATMIFIEPDPTHTKVMKSWLCCNMFPKGNGEVVGRRDLTQAGENTSIDLAFTAITQFGLGVDAFAQTLLDGINITGANPYTRQAFLSSISPDVARQAAGYKNQVETAASKSIIL